MSENKEIRSAAEETEDEAREKEFSIPNEASCSPEFSEGCKFCDY